MEIVLAILKVVGLILLVFIAVVLLVSILVLFHPFVYRIRLEKKTEELYAKIQISHLWFALRFTGKCVGPDYEMKARVFGIPVWKYPSKPKKQKKDQTQARNANPEKELVKSEQIDTKQEKENIWNKIRFIPKKICDIINKCLGVVKGFIQKKDSVLAFLKHKDVKRFLKLSKTQIQALGKCVRPTKADGYLKFGLEDPCSTGQVLGIVAMFLPVYSSYIQIIPSFEEACFEIDWKGKGKIRVFSVLMILKRWFLNDTCRRCKRRYEIMKEEIENGRE